DSGCCAGCGRLVDRLRPDSALHGYLSLAACRRHLAAADYPAAEAAISRAAGFAERSRDEDLLTIVRCFEGRVLLAQGQIERGLALLDESMVAAAAGEVSPHTTGLVYCMAIANCQRVYALDRA